MPRNMSFAATQEQIKNKTKTVTRRLGWNFLKVGDELNAVNKTMGFKKGESPIHLAKIRVVSIRQEPIAAITADDVRCEGFPEMSPNEFVSLFERINPKCSPETVVNRIEFEYQ